jgi:fructokinase
VALAHVSHQTGLHHARRARELADEADTVGSGDAFTAALVYHYLRRDSLATMNEAANRMGSWVASQTGATPAPDEARLELIRAAAQ